MKRFLLYFFTFLSLMAWSQCPDGNNTDTDGDGVADCIDPCPQKATSALGNLSFESDFIGWTIPQNETSFSINEDSSNVLHDSKSLYVNAPNSANFETHIIYSEEFILDGSAAFNIVIPIKRIGSNDGDAIRWVLIDDNGIYRSFNNIFTATEDWSNIEINNYVPDFTTHTSTRFRLQLEFGLSTTDMVVDRIELYKTTLTEDPSYKDLNNDGLPDCDGVNDNHPDLAVLETLYQSMTGDIWNNNTNWLDPTQPISTWFGITETNGRVTRIDLNTNQLQGTIPPEIGDLTMLDYLDLRSNFLFGNLPTELGNLQNATWFDFRFNSFDGEIPSSIATIPNLFVFIVSNNNFSGTLPDFSTQSTNALDFLWIENNQFVFADFENEFSTYSTNIGSNFIYNPQQFIDEIDGIVANIGDIVTLNALPNLGTNVNIDWYTGDTFELIGNGPSINITVNSEADYRPYIYFVTSPIVTGLGLQSQNITIGPDPSTHPDYNGLLAIYNNMNGPNWTNPWDITKPINFWDSNNFALIFDETTNRLTDLELGSRGLTGTIPPEIEELTELKTLNFFLNDISGEIPLELWNLTKLKTILLGAQESGQLLLSSGIPTEISNLQELEWLNLTGVPLSLPLQPELFNLPNLLRLRLENCGLSGTLPDEFASIFDLRLNGNDFTGSIPQAILNSTGNNRLAISNNYFNFSELEPLVAAGNYQFLEYSPQRTLDTEQTVNSAPGTDITLNVNDSGINRETSMNNTYQWYKDTIAISGADENTYTIFNAQASDSGIYYCEITNPLVPDLIIRRADITLNIDDTLTLNDNDQNNISLYPNPFNNWITINLPASNSKVELQIFDINGRLVFNKELTSSTNLVELSNFNSGIYLARLTTNAKIITKKIIKQ